MKEKEEALQSELSLHRNERDAAQAEKEAAAKDIEDLRTQLAASEAKIAEVKKSAKAQLQKASEKIRALTDAADSKGQQLNDLTNEITRLTAQKDDLTAQLAAVEKDNQERIHSLEEELQRGSVEMSELRVSLEAALSSAAALEESLHSQQQEQLAAVSLQSINYLYRRITAYSATSFFPVLNR